jgi:hypothetical protein
VLIAPAGQSLPAAADPEALKQPRMRMARSSDLSIVWAMTLLLVIVVTHVQLRGVWSLVVIVMGFGGVWHSARHFMRIPERVKDEVIEAFRDIIPSILDAFRGIKPSILDAFRDIEPSILDAFRNIMPSIQ